MTTNREKAQAASQERAAYWNQSKAYGTVAREAAKVAIIASYQCAANAGAATLKLGTQSMWTAFAVTDETAKQLADEGQMLVDRLKASMAKLKKPKEDDVIDIVPQAPMA